MSALLLFLALARDPIATPGALCSPVDLDFDHVATAGNYAVCRRHVTRAIRRAVFVSYGIPRGRWAQYELDHFIPLCAGGSNSPANLWPEPLADAAKKDRLEARVCALLRRGAITQDQAVDRMR